jgi:hypothetical protein
MHLEVVCAVWLRLVNHDAKIPRDNGEDVVVISRARLSYQALWGTLNTELVTVTCQDLHLLQIISWFHDHCYVQSKNDWNFKLTCSARRWDVDLHFF